MLFRLRLAVELDCDVRVLRGGIRPLTYGSLLIEMAGRGSGLSLGAPALAGSPTTLERRLRAMTTRLPRFAAVRASALGALGAAILAAACDTRMPTAPEVEAMDVAAAETQAKRFGIVSENGKTSYFVDGEQVSAEEARALGGDKIARMEMVRRQGAEGTRFVIRTRRDGADQENRIAVQGEDRFREAPIVRMTMPAPGEEPQRMVLARGFEGLVFIDGALADPSRLKSVYRDQIEKIEVLKGAAAAKLHSDPKAANGVIRITTKAGAAEREGT